MRVAMEVFHAYAKALIHVAVNLSVSFAVATAIGRVPTFRPSRRIELLFSLAGRVVLLVAGLGKLGWSIQTWGGNSPIEVLNGWVFLGLSHLGMFLVFTEWAWSHSRSIEA